MQGNHQSFFGTNPSHLPPDYMPMVLVCYHFRPGHPVAVTGYWKYIRVHPDKATRV